MPFLLVAPLLAVAPSWAEAAPPTRDVLFVGNNWDGTADVIDPPTFTRLGRIDIVPDREERMAEIQRDPIALGYFAGYPDMSSAVRAMALSPDERFAYLQISFFHGFVEYDLEADRVLRVSHLPLSEEAERTPREQYLLDLAHHGLMMNPEGTKLCAAGTMSDHAAIVRRDNFAHTNVPVGEKPYWSTNSGDGRYCFESVSGDDAVSSSPTRRSARWPASRSETTPSGCGWARSAPASSRRVRTSGDGTGRTRDPRGSRRDSRGACLGADTAAAVARRRWVPPAYRRIMPRATPRAP